jgi:hypothetical protein
MLGFYSGVRALRGGNRKGARLGDRSIEALTWASKAPRRGWMVGRTRAGAGSNLRGGWGCGGCRQGNNAPSALSIGATVGMKKAPRVAGASSWRSPRERRQRVSPHALTQQYRSLSSGGCDPDHSESGAAWPPLKRKILAGKVAHGEAKRLSQDNAPAMSEAPRTR